MSRSGADLALLLLGGYRTLVESAMTELASHGHGDFRPGHEFAMRAIASGADSASELGRRMSVTKQAAAKTIAVLTERGYVTSAPDPADGRRKRLQVTPRGIEAMELGEAAFERSRAAWEERLSTAELVRVESALRTVVGDRVVDPEAAGWSTDSPA
ncbi:DNA-binding MarR family transcriptional regulator [Diaminobutyricimonas aerilata]|uniref:DNA-binding MarR family transcriptional regulator n=1 Tax=Diaminobutyricimonas aerilata TaxID=1162967 RepID=A0A2M9CL83_9MICO|nr:MarR family transcriptional regulator [Diaminobutyricimonas aerilata]PJJ72648.1 DNA-binding MarR family transcriptional regulator [Diaminobutyricimonas aerilata]